MADDSQSKFFADYAKRVSNCKKCRQQIHKGALRLARLGFNPFSKDTDRPVEMKNYFHPSCLFETLSRCRATTKVIESPADVDGFGTLEGDDKKMVVEEIDKLEKLRAGKFGGSPAKRPPKKAADEPATSSSSGKPKETAARPAKKSTDDGPSASNSRPEKVKPKEEAKRRSEKKQIPADGGTKQKAEISRPNDEERISKFDSFKLFCKLCGVISSVSKYKDKSTAVNMFVTKDDYDGDLLLLVRLLIPDADQRVYNLKEKQLIKLFSNIFSWQPEELTDDFNQTGDVSVTVRKFFEKECEPNRKSQLSNQDVDRWLHKLTEYTREEDQQKHLTRITKRATPAELMYVLRLIKKDLRMNSGAKHILEGIKSGAYEAYQNSRDLSAVIQKCQSMGPTETFMIDNQIALGTPVKPMLAEACRSVDQAMKRCANGMYGEIKYDGERLQLHKHGDKFSFFSRSLKPVQEHKVSHLSDVIAEAFPKGGDMILDSEVLMVDTGTGKPLPFGTLGVHKKEQFANAAVCLFVFDCILFNGRSLVDRPLKERRKLLEKNLQEVPNRILLSNYQIIKPGEHTKLQSMIWKAIDEGLEGLVLKDVDSIYEPGKRHWLKVKKDYLEEGKMADTADLLVLGAYYGTGSKGGMMSVFLMGVHDEKNARFLTVTKCGNGHDDATLDRVNKELLPKMRKISREFDNLPSWIKCSRSLVPDFIIEDPKEAPVWEITGAEFSRSDNHTAGGISIRFPRVTKIRDDKSWQTATNLDELKKLFDTSKQKSDLDVSVEDAIPLYAKDSLNMPNDLGEGTADAEEEAESRKSKRSEDRELPGPSEAGDDLPSPAKRRKVDEEDDKDCGTQDVKKDSKPPCKYGAECYRKNPAHREKYSHPCS